jgi:uncharacterized damage-inducible protein DinB
MLKFFEALLDQFSEMHTGILKAIDELPPDALDWTPGSETNSLSMLVIHISGAERYWIGDVVKGEPSFRVRSAEFQVKGMNAPALKQRILDLDIYEKVLFERLGLPQLEEDRVSPRDGRTVTVSWALLHALEHTALHLGHIEILLQQWKQKAGHGN